jgi:FKBP-type peptidyl-prolyl cis-trans isomerase FklB
MSRTLPPLALALLISSNLLAQEGQAPAELPAAAAESGKPVYSYAIGLEIGKNFKADDVELDFDSLLAGIKDAMAKSGAVLRYDEATCRKALQQLSMEKQNALVTQNKKFLEENKKVEGVVTLPSGLQYKVVKAGTGATPGPTDMVRTHYEGKLIDGTVFDSSYQRNEPAEFPVNRVIDGWTEALQKMKVGDKWQLFIPSELAYKDTGSPPAVPPHATLIFDIELLDVIKQ